MRLRALAALVLLLCLSVRPIGAGGATITITPSVVPTAADNDFTRIQNALSAAGPGDTIILQGTFDFTEANAAVSWALGGDGIVGTADDYSVYIPGGTDNVTLTANVLGDATIQGPGDLAAVNLEGFLFFDGGNNHGWTVSNLRIQDFDLAIGMFGNAAGAFDGMRIQNNYIRLARDLNATVAPADVNQNIAIHFSFGTNQSILNNTIEIPGDAVSDSANGQIAADVGMQSNSAPSVGIYNGLTIAGNVIRVLNAQSADPETIIGIWENGQDHNSNVMVANNTFVNFGAGNDPALNRQRAFRVTSHSSATTVVTYQANFVDGANMAFQWITGLDFTALQPVVLRGNQITNSNIGVLVQSNGVAHLVGNVITGSGIGGGVHVLTGHLAGYGAESAGASNNTITGGARDGIWLSSGSGGNAAITLNDLSGNAVIGLRNDTTDPVDATTNWWGSNLQATVLAGASGSVNTDPWLASGSDVDAGLFGFQPFVWATSSGPTSHTTFVGTGADDTGSLLAGDPVTMTLDGLTAVTALGQLTGIDVDMGASNDVFTLGHVGVPIAFDGGAGTDTLAGTDVAQTWTIANAGTGSLSPGSITFVNVEALRGGAAADAFVFGAVGTLARSVDGGLGSDSFDNTAMPGHTTSVTGVGSLDGYAGNASGAPFDNIETIAGTSADLIVEKFGPSERDFGSSIAYTINVFNSGPDAALGATLSDALPPGTTFASLDAPAGWSCTTPAVGATGTVSCTKPVAPAGIPGMFMLTVNGPPAPGDITNTATVSSTTADPDSGSNSSSATTTVLPQADVAVTKSAPSTAVAGTSITYNITVSNNGPHNAPSVSLADALPANTVFNALTQETGPAFSCTTPAHGSSGTVTCTIASLANGMSASFSLVVDVAATAPAGSLSNTTTVSTTATDPQNTNNSTTATTTITQDADLAISMTGPSSVVAGQNVVYTVTVTNNGPSTAANVVVADPTPAGLTFVNNAGACTAAYPCSLGTFAPGASQTITTTMSVAVSAPEGPASNTATVSSSAGDSSNGNNSATATTTITHVADLAISVSGPTSRAAGGPNLVYTVTVTNNGPSDAANVSVADATPTGLTFVGNTGACATAYTCPLGTLAAGASAVITTTMAIPASFAGASVSNTPSVTTSTTDPDTADNVAIATTLITHTANVAITMGGPSSGAAGSTLVYTVTVTNNGPSDATSVSVADVTPAGLTFVSNTGACTTAYPCALGTIAPGASATITTTIAIPAGFAGPPVVNTATVAAAADPDSSDNSATVTTTITGCPSLTLTPSTLRTAIVGNGYSQTFTLTGGGTPATFAITGALPSGVSLSGAVLSGTPAQRGTFAFTLTATEAGGCQVAVPLTLAVSRERLITVGEGAGGGPHVRRFANLNPAPAAGPLGEFDAFAPSFGGGVSVASGDTDGDGAADVIAGAGPGGAPLVNVFSGANGALRLSFLAYPASLATGVEVASGDVNNDGFADIITAPGFGGPPLVRVFDGRTAALIREWLALAPDWTGGLHVGAGDVNGDGFADIVTGAGPGGNPLVQVFDGVSGAVVRQFDAYASEFRGGVYVAAGDVNGDGFADIVTGAGAGGGPHVHVFDAVTGAPIAGSLGSFYAYVPEFTGGVRVAAGDLDGDGVADVITGSGPGGGPHVKAYDGASGNEVFGFYAFDAGVANGTFVAGPPTVRRMAVDIPQADERVATSVRVAGWALEESAIDAGIDAVHVWAYPVAGGPPIFVGATTTFIARPDVAAQMGGEFLMSGFDLSGSLPAGTYNLAVVVRNAVTHVFDNYRVVRITVQ